jgi:5-methylcytosine-specific restriction endonuclease McrA
MGKIDKRTLRKGKTYEEIFGENKAKELRKMRAENMIGNNIWQLRDHSKCGNRTNNPKPWNTNKKGNFVKGHIVTDEVREKIRLAHLGRPSPLKGKHNYKTRRENNPNWKGGITELNHLIRNSIQMRDWRKEVFKKDNYTCQKCGKNGGELKAHHIEPFSKIIKENKIKTVEDAINCASLWGIKNGKTLCVDCHPKYLCKEN